MNNRVMGIDPGDKRIGLAVSDETGTIANPHSVLHHISRAENARRIVALAISLDVTKFVIGQSLNEEGEVSFQGRKSERLGQAIQALCELPVLYWNEDFSTTTAQESRRMLGVKKGRSTDHFDAIAATIILQGYLDAANNHSSNPITGSSS